MQRRAIGSWLEGPPRDPRTGEPGERLGLPAQGPGSVARMGRRLLGIAVDWALALLIARWWFGSDPWAPLAVLAVQHLLLLATLGASIGHRVAGLQVRTVTGGGYPGPLRAAVRTALLCLVVPAVIWDADQRGMHDKAAGTVLVRR